MHSIGPNEQKEIHNKMAKPEAFIKVQLQLTKEDVQFQEDASLRSTQHQNMWTESEETVRKLVHEVYPP